MHSLENEIKSQGLFTKLISVFTKQTQTNNGEQNVHNSKEKGHCKMKRDVLCLFF